MSTTNELTFPVMSRVKSSVDLRREFGFWLQKQRESRGLSQKYVADKAGFTVTQLSRIENGQSGTKRDTVILLANIIGIGEVEALRKFAPESIGQLPEELENISFDELDKQDMEQIAEFINFKLFQKKAQKGEVSAVNKTAETKEKTPELNRKPPDKQTPEIRLSMPPNENLRDVPTYRVEDGQLVSDTEINDKAHTEKKPTK